MKPCAQQLSPSVIHFAFSGPIQLPLSFEDLSSAPESQRIASLQDAKQEEASKPFDHRKWSDVSSPPFSVSSLDSTHLLSPVITSSADGWSTNVLLDELSTLYAARRKGSNPALPPAVQFSEYARQPLAERTRHRSQRLLAQALRANTSCPRTTNRSSSAGSQIIQRRHVPRANRRTLFASRSSRPAPNRAALSSQRS